MCMTTRATIVSLPYGRDKDCFGMVRVTYLCKGLVLRFGRVQKGFWLCGEVQTIAVPGATGNLVESFKRLGRNMDWEWDRYGLGS